MNPNKLPIIQSLWIGEKLSVMEQLSISSFVKNGHPFHLYVYDDIENIPHGTVVKDASKILTRDKFFKNKQEYSYGAISDIFRYKLILEKGNYWVDTDVICLMPIDDESEYVFARAKQRTLWSPPEDTFQVESCLIKAPSGSGIMEFCYDQSIKKNPDEIVWGEIGPDLLKREVINFGLTKYVKGPNEFCPIDWRDWRRYISGSIISTSIDKVRMAVYGTKAVHLWNEMWRLNGVDKNNSFHERSIYEQLKKRYLSDS